MPLIDWHMISTWSDSSFLPLVYLSHFLSSIHSRWKSGDLNSSKLNVEDARFVLDRKPFASFHQGVTMSAKIGNQDTKNIGSIFDPGLSFDFEAKSFLISKCKYKWWNLHFSVRFLISYSLIDDVINWPSFRRLMLGKQNSSFVVMILYFQERSFMFQPSNEFSLNGQYG